MPLKPVHAGPPRVRLMKLRDRLEEFARGEGRYYPGYGLSESQGGKVEAVLGVIDELLGERFESGPG